MTEVAVDARSSMEPKYAERVRAVEQIVAKLQACEDIDDVLNLYETGMAHVQACEQKLAEAQGRFEQLTSPSR